jgi:hypothetical protein
LFHYYVPWSYNSIIQIVFTFCMQFCSISGRSWTCNGGFLSNSVKWSILNYIWPQICKIPSWEDRLLLFLTLHLIIKAWKKLVDGIQEWAHCKLAIPKVWFQKQKVEELCKEQKLKDNTFSSYSNPHDIDQKLRSQDWLITFGHWIENKYPWCVTCIWLIWI